MTAKTLPERLGLVVAKLWRGAGEAGRAAMRWVRFSARIQAARLERQRLQSQRLDKLAEIGDIVYQMYGAGRVRTARLLRLCQQIEQLEAAMARTQQHIAALHAKGSGREL